MLTDLAFWRNTWSMH